MPKRKDWKEGLLMPIKEGALLKPEAEKSSVDLDLYVDPLDRPFEQPRYKLWDEQETSETGYPSDAYIRYFMSPPSSEDDDVSRD